jgi:hypothetical protein
LVVVQVRLLPQVLAELVDLVEVVVVTSQVQMWVLLVLEHKHLRGDLLHIRVMVELVGLIQRVHMVLVLAAAVQIQQEPLVVQ